MRRLDDIFDVRYGHSLELNALKRVHAPDGVNFVSRSLRNNGVTARVECSAVPARAGELTVALGGNVLATFLQPEPFVCGRDVMILTAKNPNMSAVEKLWWARCIWENRYRYSYGRQANRTLASLLLPDSPPDWLAQCAIPTHDGLQKALGPTIPFRPTTDWQLFVLQDLFDIRKGRRVTKADRVPGSTRFIGASEKNNGITDLCDLVPNFNGGCITVPYNGNSVGVAFYQNEPFFASDDVQVLIPKEPLSKWAQLFVAAVLRHGRQRYTYGYKWNLARMKQTEIRLPATLGGAPDWPYMESFMKGLPFSAALAEVSGDTPE